MSLSHLKLSAFRCFREADFVLHPETNIYSGSNGAGKTSILEALHLLSTGKSFRSKLNKKIIHHNESSFAVFAESLIQSQTYGVSYDKQGTKKTHLNKESCSQSEMAKALPILTIDPYSYLFLDNSPQYRRKFFDWMMFHVKPDYLLMWQKLNHYQKQLSQLFKSKDRNQLGYWLNPYLDLVNQITEYRQSHFDQFLVFFNDTVSVWLPDVSCETSFYPGWSGGQTLNDIIDNEIERCFQYGMLVSGPHKMDMKFKTDGVSSKEVLSRGQKKMLALAAYMACLKLMDSATEKICVLCVDDLDAELDQQNTQLFLNHIKSLPNQKHITTLIPKNYQTLDSKVFHVKP